MNKEITFEIEEHIGQIGDVSSTGWRRELNLVSWNGKEPKYDIREWSPDHQRMGRGLTFTVNELMELKMLLGN